VRLLQREESDQRLAALKRERRSRKRIAFVGDKSTEQLPVLVLRDLKARFAKEDKLPAQPPSTQSHFGVAVQTAHSDERFQPLVEKPKAFPHSTRKRGPDLKKIRARVAFEDKLLTELASAKEPVNKGCPTVAELLGDFPKFELWGLLSKKEQEELLDGEFIPRAYARTLTMRKFGLEKHHNSRPRVGAYQATDPGRVSGASRRSGAGRQGGTCLIRAGESAAARVIGRSPHAQP
jgi:hypothetical protein